MNPIRLFSTLLLMVLTTTAPIGTGWAQSAAYPSPAETAAPAATTVPAAAPASPAQPAAQPQGQAVKDLLQVLDLVLRNEPGLAAAQSARQAAAAGVDVAFGARLPQLSAAGSIASQQTRNVGSADMATTPREGALALRQALFRGGGLLAAEDAAKANADAAAAAEEETERQLLLTTASTFYELIRAKQVVKLNSTTQTVIAEQLRQTDLAFSVGQLTSTDVAQAKARLASIEAELSAANSRLSAAESTYQALTGEPAAEMLDRPLQELLLPLPDLLAIAAKEHPRIQQNQAKLLAARHALQQAEAERYPSLDATASAGYQNDVSSKDREATVYRGGLSLTMPLYTGGSTTGRIAVARANQDQAERLLRQSERQVAQEVSRVWHELASNRVQQNAFTAAVTAADRALKGVREEAQYGQRTTLDVLNAERELLNAQVGLVQAETGVRLSNLGLRAAIGRLSRRQLGDLLAEGMGNASAPKL
jgi:outer membrane protein